LSYEDLAMISRNHLIIGLTNDHLYMQFHIYFIFNKLYIDNIKTLLKLNRYVIINKIIFHFFFDLTITLALVYTLPSDSVKTAGKEQTSTS
jgi:hypothetical protein